MVNKTWLLYAIYINELMCIKLNTRIMGMKSGFSQMIKKHVIS